MSKEPLIANSLRSSLLGDTICSLPFLNWLEKAFPGSYKHVLIDRKCSQIVPILINHPLIDKIQVSESSDKISQAEEDSFKKYDLVMEPFAPIVKEGWFNEMGVIEATFKMNWLRGMGRIDPKEWDKLTEEEKKPKLTQWFDAPRNNNYIALWSSSGYSTDPVNQKRNPTKEYWSSLSDRLIKEGYKVAQFGTRDHELISNKVLDLRHYSLFDAIRFSLGCNCSIQTDSGSSHIIGAYGGNQIVLMTYWRAGHIKNDLALAPTNHKNNLKILFNPENINNIDRTVLVDHLKEL